MFRKLTILACLMSFSPAAAGAQDVALLLNSQPVRERASEPTPAVNLMPTEDRQARTLVAANDMQGTQSAQEQRPRKTHHGLTFSEFADVHFGEYRWIYWVGAVAAIVVLHVAVVD